MSQSGWSVVAKFGDPISAQALFGLLEAWNLPCYFASNGAVPGLGTEFAILVPTEFLARAQRIREQSQVSEEELTFLATGELPDAPQKP
ncbi:MAG TPA: hypothetical protein VK700_01825 [Steroidobacteraceae bacterium]|nr:hypothetical protein [Steroidobacteraceae bacterium]